MCQHLLSSQLHLLPALPALVYLHGIVHQNAYQALLSLFALHDVWESCVLSFNYDQNGF